MNILLVNIEDGFIIIDFFDISFLNIILFYFFVKDFQKIILTSKFPKPILFAKHRINFLYRFSHFTSDKIKSIINREKSEIKNKNDFWKYYYISLSPYQKTKKSHNFFIWLIKFIFKNSSIYVYE